MGFLGHNTGGKLGKLTQMAAKFYAGAGGFSGGGLSAGAAGSAGSAAGSAAQGAGSSLLSKGMAGAQSIAGNMLSGGYQAGAGSTLMDRMKGGLSAISPQFAKSQNIASQISSRASAAHSAGIVDQLNETKLADARQIAIDKETPFDIKSIMPEGMQDVPGFMEGAMELLKVADMDGRNGTSVAEYKQWKTMATENGTYQKTITNFLGEQRDKMDKSISVVKGSMKPMIDKLNMGPSGILMSSEDEGYETLSTIREKLKDPNMAGTVDKKIAEQVAVIDKMEQQQKTIEEARKRGIAATSDQQELIKSQIKLNEAKALDLLNPGSDTFDAGTFAEWMSSGDPKKVKMAEDALLFKRVPDDVKRVNMMFGAIEESVMGENGSMNKARQSADATPRIRRMMEMIDTGHVTGKEGTIKAGLAGWAEAMGMSEERLKAEGWNDAQAYEVLGRMITGPNRVEIIGPGTVTDNEQQIMKRMGGQGPDGAVQ